MNEDLPTFENLLRDVKCGSLVHVLVVAVLLAGVDVHLVLHGDARSPVQPVGAVQRGVSFDDGRHGDHREEESDDGRRGRQHLWGSLQRGEEGGVWMARHARRLEFSSASLHQLLIVGTGSEIYSNFQFQFPINHHNQSG